MNWFYSPILTVNEVTCRTKKLWCWIWQSLLGQNDDHGPRCPHILPNLAVNNWLVSSRLFNLQRMNQWAFLEFHKPWASSVPHCTKLLRESNKKTTSVMLQVTTALEVAATRNSIDNGGYPRWNFSASVSTSLPSTNLHTCRILPQLLHRLFFRGRRTIGSSILPSSIFRYTYTPCLCIPAILSKKAQVEAKYLFHNSSWSPQFSGLMGFSTSRFYVQPTDVSLYSKPQWISSFQCVSQRPVHRSIAF